VTRGDVKFLRTGALLIALVCAFALLMVSTANGCLSASTTTPEGELTPSTSVPLPSGATTLSRPKSPHPQAVGESEIGQNSQTEALRRDNLSEDESSTVLIIFDYLMGRRLPGAVVTTCNHSSHSLDEMLLVSNSHGEVFVKAASLTDGAIVEAHGFVRRVLEPQRVYQQCIWVGLAPDLKGSGSVVDESGQPVSGASVRIAASSRRHERSPISGGVYEALSDLDGTFTFPVSHLERDVVAATPDGARGRVSLRAGVQSIVVRISAGASLHVILEGELAPSVKAVHVRQNDPSDVAYEDSATVLDGTALFRGVPPRSRLEVSLTDIPGAAWHVQLDRHSKFTRLVIVLNGGDVALNVMWSAPPRAPPATMEIRVSGDVWRRCGRVIAEDKALFPEYLLPFSSSTMLRFLDGEGGVLGVHASGPIRQVGEGTYECMVDLLTLVRGRVVDAVGAPVGGAHIQTYAYGRTAYRSVRTSSDSDGGFAVAIDTRLEVQVAVARGNDLTEQMYPPGTSSFGDLLLPSVRMVTVELREGTPGERYFISASHTTHLGEWLPPVGCFTGETVAVPVAGGSRTIVVKGSVSELVEPLQDGVYHYTVSLEAISKTVK
jgi:hypothetical protein